MELPISPSPTTLTIQLSFDEAPAETGQPLSKEQLTNEGTANVLGEVESADGGTVTSDVLPERGGVAVFGVPGANRRPRHGVITVNPVTAQARTDLLPRANDLTLSATVRQRPVADDAAKTGHNIVQWGRFDRTGGRGQVKLQADKNAVTCRLAGDEGSLVLPELDAPAQAELQPDVWYRITCTLRRDDEDPRRADVELLVERLDDGSSIRRSADDVLLGSIVPGPRPLEVGGKVAERGDDNDQFVGSIDDVVFSVHPPGSAPTPGTTATSTP